jgi:hypothetical protein
MMDMIKSKGSMVNRRLIPLLGGVRGGFFNPFSIPSESPESLPADEAEDSEEGDFLDSSLCSA